MIEPPLSLALVAAKKYFLPYREALVAEFLALGVQARGVAGLEEIGAAQGALVLGMHSFPHPRRSVPAAIILGAIHTEQLPTVEAGSLTFGKDRYRVFLRDQADYDFIFDWSPVTAAMLGRRFPRVFHLDHGCIPAEVDMGQDREYDLLFIGAPDGVDGRRARLLKELGQRFRLFPEHSGLWGGKKLRAMAGAVIVCNLHYDHGAPFEAPRLWEALSMGAFVLSEPMADSRPFVAGRDYAAAFEHQFAEAVAHYLAHAERRQAIARQGQATARAHPLAATAGRILRQFRIEAAMLRDPGYARRRQLFRRLRWERLRNPTFPNI